MTRSVAAGSPTEFVRQGRVWAFGDRVSVEAISPLRYMLNPKNRAKTCLAQLDPDFGSKVEAGALLVAGRLFGHGPGHDHANLALKEAGIAGVVAESISPQFFRHSVDHGLLVAECGGIVDLVSPGCTLKVDFGSGRVENLDSGKVTMAKVPEGRALEIMRAGGLVPFIRDELARSPDRSGIS